MNQYEDVTLWRHEI